MDGLRQAFMDELVASPPGEALCSSEASEQPPLSARVFLDLNEAGFDLGFYAFGVEVEFGADFGLGAVLNELVGES